MRWLMMAERKQRELLQRKVTLQKHYITFLHQFLPQSLLKKYQNLFFSDNGDETLSETVLSKEELQEQITKLNSDRFLVAGIVQPKSLR